MAAAGRRVGDRRVRIIELEQQHVECGGIGVGLRLGLVELRRGSVAQAALQPYLATPTKINVTTPLESAPPAGKTVVFMGTSNPSNVLVQQGVQKLAALAHWNYSLVTYDPANPGNAHSGDHDRAGKAPAIHNRGG